jgi:hypothetical protein
VGAFFFAEKIMSESVLVKVDCAAPTPVMHRRAAAAFRELRGIVREKSGHDFLARCGDIFRHASFTSNKDGVANRSWHKTGRAFDYDQTAPYLIICSEIKNGKQFFRTYLKCAKQDGSLGRKLTLRDYRNGLVTAFVFDFTQAAEELGFNRIPAWRGWERNWNRREFWHYQYDQNLTWAEAMRQLAEFPNVPKEQITANDATLGLNDRGQRVRDLQQKLVKAGLLLPREADGVFGAKTRAAVLAFQQKNNLDADGLAGPQTLAALAKL